MHAVARDNPSLQVHFLVGSEGGRVTTAWFEQRGGKYFDALRHLNEQLANMYLNERKYKGFYNTNLPLKHIR